MQGGFTYRSQTTQIEEQTKKIHQDALLVFAPEPSSLRLKVAEVVKNRNAGERVEPVRAQGLQVHLRLPPVSQSIKYNLRAN